VHWVNVPSIYPADALASDWGTWAGRWSGSGGGWSLVLDARHDHTAVLAEAKDSPFHVVTHTGVLRRTDGQAFAPKQAEDPLFAWQTMLSFALGVTTGEVVHAASLLVGVFPPSESWPRTVL